MSTAFAKRVRVWLFLEHWPLPSMRLYAQSPVWKKRKRRHSHIWSNLLNLFWSNGQFNSLESHASYLENDGLWHGSISISPWLREDIHRVFCLCLCSMHAYLLTQEHTCVQRCTCVQMCLKAQLELKCLPQFTPHHLGKLNLSFGLRDLRVFT